MDREDLEFSAEETEELTVYDYTHDPDGVGLIEGDKPILMVIDADAGEALRMSVAAAKGLVTSLNEAIWAETDQQ